MNPRMLFWLCIFPLIALLTACGGGGGSDLELDDGGGVQPPPDVKACDVEGLYVISTSPVFDSSDVETNRAVTSTFNKAIDPATITSNSFLIDNANGDIVAGVVGYDSASRTAIFRPNVSFSKTTSYTATITNAVADLDGNTLSADYTWEFTTGEESDTDSPNFTSQFPTLNASNVALNSGITITFDEPIDPSTINDEALTLSGPNPVAGAITVVGTSVLFTPDVVLVADSDYTVSVADTIKDLAGNSFAPEPEPEPWKFTTGILPDGKGPEVISVSPDDEAVNVPIDELIVVDFDEAIKPFEFGVIDCKPVIASYSDTYNTVTIEPTAGLRPGVSYTARLFVEDQAGNPITEEFSWSFTTTDP